MGPALFISVQRFKRQQKGKRRETVHRPPLFLLPLRDATCSQLTCSRLHAVNFKAVFLSSKYTTTEKTDATALDILAEKTAKLCFPESITEVKSSVLGSKEQTVLIINRMPGPIPSAAEHPRVPGHIYGDS